MLDAKEIKLIRTDFRTTGKGIEDDPIRALIQYWTHDGKLVLTFDTHTQEFTKGPADL